MRVGLYFDLSGCFAHEPEPPYVDEGVASVEARLEVSKMEAIEDALLPWLIGLLGE